MGLLDRIRDRLRPADTAPQPPPGPARADAAGTAGGGDGSILFNVYATVADTPPPGFPHVLRGRRDAADPELRPHLDGFIGYVLGRGDGEMTAVRYHVMRHLQRVRVQWSLEVAPGAFEAFEAWAVQANGLVFLPDGGVRDPQGRMLVAADGASDPEARVPYPEAARQRKARTDAALLAQGWRVSPNLPPLVSEPELQLRTPADVLARAAGLAVVALAAQQRRDGVAGRVPAPSARFPAAVPTPQEQDFVAADTPPDQDVVRFSWRYEAAHLLLWALGRVEMYAVPDGPCDVDATLAALDAASAPGAAPVLRPPGELLDALDRHYRLHWLVREARRRGQPLPPGIDPDVLAERHAALNWLVRFEDAEWDAVDTPT